ncbi:MAG TPA: hypothetical protein VJ204_19695 [Solirubrobacterales bacterium]|nr:hypothetical protein [Solirubrobacterales bacterium]
MNYQDPHNRRRATGRRHDERFWEDARHTPGWAKVVAVVIVAGGLGAAIAIFASRTGESSTQVAQTVTRQVHVKAKPAANEQHITYPAPKHEHAKAPSQVSGTTKKEAEENTGGAVSGSGGGKFLGSSAEASFDAMAASLPAQVGMAVEPLGSEEVIEFGTLLHSGHAWSSIKPAILSTVLAEQGEQLGPEEESWADGAITASDNEDAAALFHTIEGRQGGLEGASAAVGNTIHEGSSAGTVVATAPPPPGAVSTYGQTDWPVGEAVRFYHGLATCKVHGTSYIEGLMEQVIPEQRWGLGEASWPSGDRVGMKGGWGPDTEANGGYLVRQSGFVQNSEGGFAVAMIAIDESGSYPAGASDLTAMAQWLAGELKGTGPTFHSCTG